MLVSVLLVRIFLWCCVMQYSCVIVYAGCALTPDSNGHVDIPISWTTIGELAFSNCPSLVSVTIPDNVTTIGNCAFLECPSLVSVTIGDGVTTIAYGTFSSCTSLVSVTIRDSVTTIANSAFSSSNISYFTIPDSVTTIGEYAFSNCPSLVSVTIPDNVTTIAENTFEGCTSLVSVTIPDSVTTIGPCAFYECTSLASVTIPDSVTTIDNKAFYECTSLTSVTIGDSVTTIGDRVFEGCTSLVSVTIPDSVTHIGYDGFKGCTSLTFVTIDSSSSLDIGKNGFKGCSNLQNMTVHTKNNITFGSAALSDSIKLKSIVFKDTMRSIKGLPFFLSGKYQCKEGLQCGCQNGYGNYLGASMPGYFNCLPCSPGFLGNGTQSACSPCKGGTYANSIAQPLCTQCDPGKYSPDKGATSDTTCTKCPRGEYAPSPGSETCIDCPPGSFCDQPGLSIYKECTVGRYTDVKSQWYCIACPAGRYQMSNGAAKCLQCPSGTFLEGEGANSSSQCQPCSTGTYGDKEGLPLCSSCPTGQVQPAQGQDSCKECALEGKIKTNNEAHTVCVDNEALMSSSIVEMMFTKGVGLSLSFGIAAMFVCLAGAIHLMKTRYSATVEKGDKLGVLEPHQVLLKSALPGFSLGSEVTLIIGMMTESPPLGLTMLVFRLLHPLTMLVLTHAVLSPKSEWLPAFLHNKMRGASLSEEFSRSKVPLVCMLLLASACDVSVLQLMPWEESKFYTQSMGYPSMDLMLVCMGVKMLQSLVSFVCQTAYLMRNSTRNDPMRSNQARALFGLSIGLSVVTLIMGAVVLLLKWALLKKVSKELEEDRESKDGGLELGDVYKSKEGGLVVEDAIPATENPLHSAVMDVVKQKDAELEAKDDELKAKEGELEEKGKEIEQLRKQLQSVENHCNL